MYGGALAFTLTYGFSITAAWSLAAAHSVLADSDAPASPPVLRHVCHETFVYYLVVKQSVKQYVARPVSIFKAVIVEGVVWAWRWTPNPGSS